MRFAHIGFVTDRPLTHRRVGGAPFNVACAFKKLHTSFEFPRRQKTADPFRNALKPDFA